MLTRLLRGAATAGIALGVLSVMTGCLPVPTRPLALAPISVTAVGDRISFVQCLDDDIHLTYVSARIREESGQRREWAVLTAEGTAQEAVDFAPREPADLEQTFRGLPVVSREDIPLSSLDGPITFFLVLDGLDGLVVEMAFRKIDVHSLEKGSYVYYSGEVSDEPCGMPRE